MRENEFSLAWDEFLLAVRRAQARGPGEAGALSLAQYYFLKPLTDGNSLAVGELARSAGITAPTATRLIDALQRAGVLRRTRTARDRREVRVSLTPKGAERVERKHAALATRRQEVYERLAPRERRQAERLLRHLAQLLADL